MRFLFGFMIICSASLIADIVIKSDKLHDNFFSVNKVKTKIGIAFEDQIVAHLPLEKTDINMDIVITEKEIVNIKK